MKVRLLFIPLLGVSLCGQQITGERKQWHNVTLTLDGPATSETATPNPFLNYRLNVTFTRGSRSYVVPGYFAADGNAAETSAATGNKWRAHFVPDETGEWSYTVSFRTGPDVAVSLDPDAGRPIAPDGASGRFTVTATDKLGRDNRRRGMLRYTGGHYARFAGSGEYFLMAGSQSPENLLAYHEFDNTADHGGAAVRLVNGLHQFAPHIRDWRPGDPTWKDGKGKGIIGALNYLASKGMNTFYSLAMNVGGDGREIYPWTGYDELERYDVSKLAQWEVVLSHMDALGLQFMAITQEEENEQLLGKLTTRRKLYYRELIARLSHHHALIWDLDEEMDRWRYFKSGDIQQLCDYIKRLDPYRHPIQYVQWKGELLPDDRGYGRLLGFPNFDAVALQHDSEHTHAETLKWVRRSAEAGHKWLVGLIEINPTSSGVVPDADDYWHDAVRKQSIWGNLMAGGSGSIFFFGTKYPHNDLDMEDWRSRDHFWDLMRYAHEFFERYLPFNEMRSHDQLIHPATGFVFAKEGEIYAIYLPDGGTAELNLMGTRGPFEVTWYDPRFGGPLQHGSIRVVEGGAVRSIGQAPKEPNKDWTVLVRRVGPPPDASEAVSSAYLVKLGGPVASAVSRKGDEVTAVVISPEKYLGAKLEGMVDDAAPAGPARLSFRFHSLTFRGKTIPVRAVIAGFVNSNGGRDIDEEGRPVRVEAGKLISGAEALRFDEGSEFRLQLEEVPR